MTVIYVAIHILDLDPNNDPFLSSDAKQGKPTPTRRSSFDDFTTSENEISPRQQKQPKGRRNKAHRKSSVEPTMPKDIDANVNNSNIRG